MEGKSAIVREVGYDEEFRHLGYTASPAAVSSAAEEKLSGMAKRATQVFLSKPGLRDCGASIVSSVIVPKVVCPLAFAKATNSKALAIESSYGVMLRRSIGVAQGFPWEVHCSRTVQRLR